VGGFPLARRAAPELPVAEDGFAIAPEFASDPEIQEIARAMRRRIKEIRAERRAERSAEYNGDWELF
jgi:hypothetical protein